MPFYFVRCSFFLSLVRIIQIRNDETNVSIAKNFSKFVWAMMFPTVFNANRTKNIHKNIFTIFSGIKFFKYSPFIKRIEHKRRLIAIEIDSKTYISESFFNLPPQVKL